ncbi:hypothetical protein BDK61_0701 [Haloarcula quadrata]|jgi:hypothetical protein|uniref:Uncharacterized protein n=4 Tax=Haloarcula TaxID=2237 RepID=A0A4P8K1J9_HALMA|nr:MULTISPECIES: hypothetical protein [Haloarcula]EMA15142.1 hypothetical protein C436_05160 [Haloarcula sinaiiensis ATCC 33800]EMA16679.1 hypothetical protein C435_12590 [Haloarcula californiae ATCC 33799]NHN63753.1 hypothetical protein [Haloarcula sp. JP-Z28]NHX40049.1 hypothetical protein [Haloarcula sp. R1-2]QCP91955.1 hypothetical protein E6P14_14240 [Haloarcula marismortui ATCC 43049]
MQGLLSELLQSIIDMPGWFLGVALNDPLAALMLAVGAVITTVSVAAFGYLSLGAALSLFSGSGGRGPPQANR